MNKNIENYKKAIDQIHVDENLKDKVLEKAKEKQSKKPIYYLRYAVSIAAVALIAIVIGVKMNTPNGLNKEVLDSSKKLEIAEENKEELLARANIKRFSSIEELRETLENNSVSYEDIYNSRAETVKTDSIAESGTANADLMSKESSLDYSKTNNQVENVDEADIVKTDGKYIYYCQNLEVYIYDNDLNLKTNLNFEDGFAPSNIFINDDKLVVLGSNNGFNKEVYLNSMSKDVEYENEKTKTIVRVYDLKNIENPELAREISVDGYYKDARMIEKNIYFVTTYGFGYYRNLEELTDDEILPCYKDSFISDDDIVVEATDIAYFEEMEDNTYSIVAGFNLDSDEDVNIETFLGFGEDLYVSTENLYIVSPNYYNRQINDSTIYKFRLKDGDVFATGSAKVEGSVNNQFSIDEYEGNLRIATTIYDYDRENYQTDYKTRLTIFDENLEKIGEIENLIEDERIYSVRFIGEIGYIVTFEQVDPLWVIDLSDPKNPVIRGELEIPGYSSYLHPWDENHIIGIGYNVKPNGYGGVTTDGIKLSMFDVSDLDNPKEIFNISLGTEFYSQITTSHHLLFINKDKNLLGFPVSTYIKNKQLEGLILYRVDLENNKFEEIKDLVLEKNSNGLSRFIYIGDYIYGLYYKRIEKYDINSFEKVQEVPVPSESKLEYYYNTRNVILD